MRSHNAIENGNAITLHPAVFVILDAEIIPDECHRFLRSKPLGSETFVKGFRELLIHVHVGSANPYPSKGIDSPRAEKTQTFRTVFFERYIEGVEHKYRHLIAACSHVGFPFF